MCSLALDATTLAEVLHPQNTPPGTLSMARFRKLARAFDTFSCSSLAHNETRISAVADEARQVLACKRDFALRVGRFERALPANVALILVRVARGVIPRGASLRYFLRVVSGHLGFSSQHLALLPIELRWLFLCPGACSTHRARTKPNTQRVCAAHARGARFRCDLSSVTRSSVSVPAKVQKI